MSAFEKVSRGDPFKTQEWADYAERVVRDMVPKMEESALVVSIATSGKNADVKLAVEIGYALLLGKPLVLMAEKEGDLPPGLTRAADEIVYGEVQHPKTQTKLLAAIQRVVPDIEAHA